MNNLKLHWVVIAHRNGRTTATIEEDQADAIRKAVAFELSGMAVKLTTLSRFLKGIQTA